MRAEHVLLCTLHPPSSFCCRTPKFYAKFLCLAYDVQWAIEETVYVCVCACVCKRRSLRSGDLLRLRGSV